VIVQEQHMAALLRTDEAVQHGIRVHTPYQAIKVTLRMAVELIVTAESVAGTAACSRMSTGKA